MKKYLLILTFAVVTSMTAFITGCGGNDNKDVEEISKTAQEEAANSTGTMTKEEYAEFLEDRYEYYLDNDELDAKYDVYNFYDEEFSYMGSYDEFLSGLNQFAGEERTNLEGLKKELETKVKRGNPEVDAVNDEIIAAINEAILSSDTSSKDFETKAKDYGTYTKDEVIKGLRDLGRVPYEARKAVEDLVEKAKEKLGN